MKFHLAYIYPAAINDRDCIYINDKSPVPPTEEIFHAGNCGVGSKGQTGELEAEKEK